MKDRKEKSSKVKKEEKNLKERRGSIIRMLPLLIFLIILYILFRDSGPAILEQLLQTDWRYFVPVVLLGILYECMDALPYWLLMKYEGENIRYREVLSLIYLGIFLNVTTFGAGIKPAQTYYLYKKGINTGKAFSLMTVPYVFHKTGIMIYAGLALLLWGDELIALFGSSHFYIYAGFLVSAAIILGLILVCTSQRLNRLLVHFLDRLSERKEKWASALETWKNSLGHLHQESSALVKNPLYWGIALSLDLVKMICYYSMPFFAVKAVGGDVSLSSLPIILGIYALIQILVGVIPSTGGLGPAEVLYLLMFTPLFGEAAAGSTMVLCRIGNYYFPFLIGMITAAGVLREKKRESRPF